MMLFDAGLDWLAHGLLAASWWQIVLYALVTTHITIASVTITCIAIRHTERWTCTRFLRTFSASGCGWVRAR